MNKNGFTDRPLVPISLFKNIFFIINLVCPYKDIHLAVNIHVFFVGRDDSAMTNYDGNAKLLAGMLRFIDSVDARPYLTDYDGNNGKIHIKNFALLV